MFTPFTFIVVEARTHGMSQYLANYLVPILNGARSVLWHSLPPVGPWLTRLVLLGGLFLMQLPTKSDASMS